ncbi:MAG: ABC transporter ATP-binding protein/permease [Bacteroidia bacterium]|nr:ABC transporter ATP-binding protein/permease [Bacteroidia bacterium]MCX7651930.1 ABC transporter ATP-binding protein/permease [Bacteroidia bacterium]MDW8416081.1 ABC transporter ATP-binding protein [Bacteroidia bacterium]
MKSFAVTLRLLRLLVAQKRLFGIALLLVTLASLFQPLRPYLYRYVIDHPLKDKDAHALLLWGGVLVGMSFLHALVQRGQTLFTQRLAWAVSRQLRRALFEKVLRLSIPSLEKYPTGILYTRTLTDTQTLQSTLAETFLVIAGEILQLTFLVGLMLFVDTRLTAITLLVMPLGLWASQYFSRKIRESFARVRLYIARMNGYLQEIFQSRELTESMGAEPSLWSRFLRLNRLYYLSYRRVIGYFAWFFPTMETVTLVGLSAVLLFGGYLIYQGETTVGSLVAFTLYQQLFFRPFRIIADQVNSLQMGIVSADRIFRLLDQNTEESLSGVMPQLKYPYTLEIENLHFGYTADREVLRGLSLRLVAGKVYGISAPTGTGKSTLFYLLLGYYEPQEGVIRFGGVPLPQWNKAYLREMIAYIPQEPVLFEGTLRENLTLYEDIPDTQIWEAAERLGFLKYVQAWSLDQSVGVGGGALSAGERQLVALWRAALRRPAVWILDEPTAHIDPQMEGFIYRGLRYLAKDSIVMIVAHSPDTQAYCDEVIKLSPAHAA